MGKKGILLLTVGVIATGQSLAGEVFYRVDFRADELELTTGQGYQFARMAGCDVTDRVGEPQVPVKLLHLLLPEGSRATGVEVIRTREEELTLEHDIYPAQPPEILPIPGVALERRTFVEPEAAVYSSSSRYPATLVELAGCGNMGAYRIASVLVYPLQYLPREKRLFLHSEVEFKLQLREGLPPPWRRSESLREFLKALLFNGEALDSAQSSQSGERQYLIITSSAFRPAFQLLADWKSKKGVPAIVVTTDSIYANSPGRDDAEKVRNFIRDAHLTWGTEWVLLGGDTDVVPDRVAYAMTSGAGIYPDEDSLRADLYYSDLDGTWDLNNNSIFGEVDDSVDLYPDVIVGRAPVNTLTEAETFVAKILTYEKTPPLDYELAMLFLAEILWIDPYTDSGIAKNRIDSLCVPPRYDPIEKLYESLGNENYATVMAALNAGKNIANHNGHANYSIMGIGDGFLLKSDMDALVNGARQGLLYSIGCWPAAFDYDCIAEHWVNNPNGGGIAFIGNSRYGWGSPGNPQFGYSDRFDETFYDKLLLRDVYHLGTALALGKAHYIPKSRVANVYRWHQYQINLLGEPELPIWTDIPSSLLVSFPDSIPVGTVRFAITVREREEPVCGALVCLAKSGEVYSFAHTGLNGQAMFEVSPSSSGGLALTATAHNHLPYEDSCWVFPTGPWVGYLSHAISGGNGDSEVNPGETVGMEVTLKNFGSLPANDVSATLRSEDTLAVIVDSVQSFADLGPGDTATSAGDYSFYVSPACENGQVIYLTLCIEDHSGNSWENLLGLQVAAPLLQFVGYLVDDTTEGNGNGIPEPGETLALSLWIENRGLGLARNVTGTVSTADPYVTVLREELSFGSIPPKAQAVSVSSLRVDPGCPSPRFAELTLQAVTSDGYSSSHHILLAVGPTGFSDDVESGPGGWSHGGSGDLWHITAHRANSETHSWYCGNDTTRSYQNDQYCYLLTPPIVLSQNSSLSFWVWYDVSTYGVDGLYVEVVRTGGCDTLDFIGSGGALLPDPSIGNPWLQETYDLSHIPYGETVQVKFSFCSDGAQVAEGFYLDDIQVAGVALETEAQVQPLPPPEEPVFLPLRPNPFARRTEIRYGLPAEEEVVLTVYDLGGRLVTTLVNGRETRGYHLAFWDGRDNKRGRAASGVYFCLLKTCNLTRARRALLIR